MKKILELTEHTTTGEIPEEEEEEETVDFDVEGRRHGESVGPQSGATGEVEGDEVREGEGGVAADIPGQGPTTRMEGREDQVGRHPQRRRGHAELPESVGGEGVQRRRGRGAIRQHAAAGGVEVPDQ